MRLSLLSPVLIPETCSIRFGYEHAFSERSPEYYEETLALDPALWNTAILRSPAGTRLLLQLSLALGLSYWKMYVPRVIKPYEALTREEAAAWNIIYRDALGEFFFQNQLDPLDREPFIGSASLSPQEQVSTSSLAIVPFGGGKDSLLTLHLLSRAGIPCEVFTLGTSMVQEQSLNRLGLSAHVVRRTLDPEMIRKSKGGEVYNGHVSITLIYALSAALVALLRGARYVVFSNESSANEGNTVWKGHVINHQWSKSLEAERLIRELLHGSVSRSLTVFSLLRPLSEVGIVARVAQELPHLIGSFSSCNRNFVIASERPTRNNAAYWCGICPKCAFVGLLFATFLSPEDLERMIGSQPLANESLIPLFQDLLGVGKLKPFECVGTPEETRSCFAKLLADPRYQHFPVVRWVREHALAGGVTPIEELLQPNAQAIAELPSPFQTLL